MDLTLNNLQRLICHKTQPTKQTTNQLDRLFLQAWRIFIFINEGLFNIGS